MDLIISWLTEEWYHEILFSGSVQITGPYMKWTTRIFENILPFIESKDSKSFLRFLGDVPYLQGLHVKKLGILCLDPE